MFNCQLSDLIGQYSTIEIWWTISR